MYIWLLLTVVITAFPGGNRTVEIHAPIVYSSEKLCLAKVNELRMLDARSLVRKGDSKFIYCVKEHNLTSYYNYDYGVHE